MNIRELLFIYLLFIYLGKNLSMPMMTDPIVTYIDAAIVNYY